MSKPITTISFFTVAGIKDGFWAFSQVPQANRILENTPGLTFMKSMGSGSGKGFSVFPSFKNYCWVMAWEDETLARNFIKNNDYLAEYSHRSQSVSHLFLENIASHGEWSKQNPFTSVTEHDEDANIVVLTRARIKLGKLFTFWTKVGKTAGKLYQFPALKFSTGVGERPLIDQATISIWENKAQMMHYAYKDETHKNVIQLTRKYEWYSEELFARFVLKDSINLEGLVR